MEKKSCRRINHILGLSTILSIATGMMVTTALPAQAAGTTPWGNAKLSQLYGVTWVSDLSPHGTITFTNNTVYGNDSCNIFHGSYTYKKGTLTFGPIMQTMMYCDKNHPVQRAFDRMFNSANTFTVHYRLNGTKRLTVIPLHTEGLPLTFTSTPRTSTE